MILDILAIAILLIFTFKVYQMYLTKSKQMRRRPRRARKGQEGFAFESSPQSTSLGPYKCYQNDYRPEVITTFGEHPTIECEQSLCKD